MAVRGRTRVHARAAELTGARSLRCFTLGRRPSFRDELVRVPVRRSEGLPGVTVRHDVQLPEQLDAGRARKLVARQLDVVDQEARDDGVGRELPGLVGRGRSPEELELRAVVQ